MIFIDSQRFFFENIVLYIKTEPGWWRMGPEYILEYFWIRNAPETPHFDPQTFIFYSPSTFFFENFTFYFFSLTHFFLYKSPNPRCTKCSHGPYGPCWFSAKKRQDMEKRYQKHDFWGKVTF